MQIEKLQELLNFFDPVELKDFSESSFLNDEGSIGKSMHINHSVRPLAAGDRFEVAFFTVNQHIDQRLNECNSPQKIREELYRLKKHAAGLHIADLGQLKTGKNIYETLYAVQEVCSILYNEKINVLLAGGDQLLSLGGFKALTEYDNNINVVHIDSKIDLPESEDSVKETYYLNTIIEKEAANLYNIACLGFQTYLTSHRQLKTMNEWYFENYRLGTLREDLREMEPVMRDANLISFDVSVIRMADAPGQRDGSPNGLYAEEACTLSRYAGMSESVQFFGFFEYAEAFDKNRQTAKLVAQIFWYYLQGYQARKHEKAENLERDFTKYEVQIDEIEFPIVFYKSLQTERWWINVSAADPGSGNHDGFLVACSEQDYLLACKNEIPERWWINYKKLK